MSADRKGLGPGFERDTEQIRRLFRDQLISWTEAREALRIYLPLRPDEELVFIPPIPGVDEPEEEIPSDDELRATPAA